MADDDLDMLQQLLEMAEDDDASEASAGRKEQRSPVSHPTDHENVPPNKRPRLSETIKPLTAGKSRQVAECKLMHGRYSTAGSMMCFCSVPTGHTRLCRSSQQQCTCSPDKDWRSREVLRSPGKSSCEMWNVVVLMSVSITLNLHEHGMCLVQMKNPCLPSVVLKERLSHVRFEKLSQARYTARLPHKPRSAYTRHDLLLRCQEAQA